MEMPDCLGVLKDSGGTLLTSDLYVCRRIYDLGAMALQTVHTEGCLPSEVVPGGCCSGSVCSVRKEYDTRRSLLAGEMATPSLRAAAGAVVLQGIGLVPVRPPSPIEATECFSAAAPALLSKHGEEGRTPALGAPRL